MTTKEVTVQYGVWGHRFQLGEDQVPLQETFELEVPFHPVEVWNAALRRAPREVRPVVFSIRVIRVGRKSEDITIYRPEN